MRLLFEETLKDFTENVNTLPNTITNSAKHWPITTDYMITFTVVPITLYAEDRPSYSEAINVFNWLFFWKLQAKSFR